MSQFGITEYPNTFKRQGSFPLDKTSVFNSLNDAVEYAKSNLTAYEGQLISVVENDNVSVYVLKKSLSVNTNYELSSIASDNSGEINLDIYNVINNKIGTWSITRTFVPNTDDESNNESSGNITDADGNGYFEIEGYFPLYPDPDKPIIFPNTDTNVYFEFDIMNSFNADSFEICFNDESVTEILSLSDAIIVPQDIFDNISTTNISLKFYNNSNLSFTVNAQTVTTTERTIFGSLYLVELF